MVRRSTEILASWCTRLDNVPDITQLPAVVQAELPRSIPSPYQPSFILDRPANDVVSFAQHEVVTADLSLILASIHFLPKCGDNEDSVHSLVDALVLRPIKIVGEEANCEFQVNRNGADYTGATVRNLRPDVLLWLPSGVLAFKGEDKATAAERHLARNELLTKLNCFSEAFFGRVPYQICYNAGGTILEFVAISRLTAGRPTLVSLSPTVNLSTVRGRSLCVRFALNIARVLVSLQETYPEGSVVRLGDKVETPNSSVNVFGEYVIKKTAHHSGDVLKELYAAIRQGQPPFLVSSPKDVKINRRGVLTVHLSPVGFCGKTPEGLAAKTAAGRRVLEALRWLHDNGWVHRDIRTHNILWAGGQWYLMDLEWANRINSPIGSYNPSREFLPPELVGGGEEAIWTASCDMWQFGKLVEFWDEPAGNAYVRVQTAECPGDRLSAEESLSHEFFSL